MLVSVFSSFFSPSDVRTVSPYKEFACEIYPHAPPVRRQAS